MRTLLALLVGAALGAVAARVLGRRASHPAPLPTGPDAARVRVDVSGVADGPG